MVQAVPHTDRVLAELVRHGYSTDDLRKIYLENFLRVFASVAG